MSYLYDASPFGHACNMPGCSCGVVAADGTLLRPTARQLLEHLLDAIDKEWREQDHPVEMDLVFVVAQEVREAMSATKETQ